MKNLSILHESFIEKARRPMSFGNLPVVPRDKDVPIMAVNRWNKSDNSLIKTYDFISKDLRNDFVRQILMHEERAGHHCTMTIQNDSVTLTLQTRDIAQITELDREFAKCSDEIFKDVVYSLSHEQ